jgi:hypothetical protein
VTRKVFQIVVKPDQVALMANKWAMVPTKSGNHVVPISDLRLHEDCRDCWCSPSIRGREVSHNSLDGRELYEQGARMRS